VILVPGEDSSTGNVTGGLRLARYVFRLSRSSQLHPSDRQVASQCLARASATHFLTTLCCAHNDISLYLARSLTSARQVAVACFTAALSGLICALTNVGARRTPQAITVAIVVRINDLPLLCKCPQRRFLATLYDSHATLANSTCSINVASSTFAFELLTRFDTAQRFR
jgi:hypothetical protein